MQLIASALGFGLVLGFVLDAYAGFHLSLVTMFKKAF